MKFLRPSKGRTQFGIGVCGRCNRKFFLDDLREDPNVPGLMVCSKDSDIYDPYRYAGIPSDIAMLRNPRPDVRIEVDMPITNPVIYDIDSDSHAVAGGYWATLAGDGFVEGASCTFGGASCPSVEVIWTDRARVIVPSGSGTVDVVWTNTDTGTGTLTNGFTYG